jgi:hypothetical protein
MLAGRGTQERHLTMRMSARGCGRAVSTVLGIAVGLPLALPAAAGELPLGALDEDRDGVLSAAEHAAGARAMFSAMDADHDSSVTPREMTAAQPAIHGGQAVAAPTSEEKIAVVDGDGDGQLSAHEHASGSSRMFTRMDTNRDGRLTPAQFDAGHAGLRRDGARR